MMDDDEEVVFEGSALHSHLKALHLTDGEEFPHHEANSHCDSVSVQWAKQSCDVLTPCNLPTATWNQHLKRLKDDIYSHVRIALDWIAGMKELEMRLLRVVAALLCSPALLLPDDRLYLYYFSETFCSLVEQPFLDELTSTECSWWRRASNIFSLVSGPHVVVAAAAAVAGTAVAFNFFPVSESSLHEGATSALVPVLCLVPLGLTGATLVLYRTVVRRRYERCHSLVTSVLLSLSTLQQHCLPPAFSAAADARLLLPRHLASALCGRLQQRLQEVQEALDRAMTCALHGLESNASVGGTLSGGARTQSGVREDAHVTQEPCSNLGAASLPHEGQRDNRLRAASSHGALLWTRNKVLQRTLEVRVSAFAMSLLLQAERSLRGCEPHVPPASSPFALLSSRPLFPSESVQSHSVLESIEVICSPLLSLPVQLTSHAANVNSHVQLLRHVWLHGDSDSSATRPTLSSRDVARASLTRRMQRCLLILSDSSDCNRCVHHTGADHTTGVVIASPSCNECSQNHHCAEDIVGINTRDYISADVLNTVQRELQMCCLDVQLLLEAAVACEGVTAKPNNSDAVSAESAVHVMNDISEEVSLLPCIPYVPEDEVFEGSADVTEDDACVRDGGAGDGEEDVGRLLAVCGRRMLAELRPILSRRKEEYQQREERALRRMGARQQDSGNNGEGSNTSDSGCVAFDRILTTHNTPCNSMKALKDVSQDEEFCSNSEELVSYNESVYPIHPYQEGEWIGKGENAASVAKSDDASAVGCGYHSVLATEVMQALNRFGINRKECLFDAVGENKELFEDNCREQELLDDELLETL